MAASLEGDRLSVTSSDLGSSFGCDGDLGSPSDLELATHRDILQLETGKEPDGGRALLSGRYQHCPSRSPGKNTLPGRNVTVCRRESEEQPQSKFERARRRFLQAEMATRQPSGPQIDKREKQSTTTRSARPSDLSIRYVKTAPTGPSCQDSEAKMSRYYSVSTSAGSRSEDEAVRVRGKTDEAERVSSERSVGTSSRTGKLARSPAPGHQGEAWPPSRASQRGTFFRDVRSKQVHSPATAASVPEGSQKNKWVQKSLSVPEGAPGYSERLLRVPEANLHPRYSAELSPRTPPPTPLSPPVCWPPGSVKEEGILSGMSPLSGQPGLSESPSGTDSPQSVEQFPAWHREGGNNSPLCSEAFENTVNTPARREVSSGQLDQSPPSPTAELGQCLQEAGYGQTSSRDLGSSTGSRSGSHSPASSTPRLHRKSCGRGIRRVSSFSEAPITCSSTGVPPSSKETLTSRLRHERNHLEHARSLDPADFYLTPSQRKDLLIKELRLHVRQLQGELDKKEREMADLRTKMAEERERLQASSQRQLEEARSLADMSREEVTSLQESHEESVKTVASLQQDLDDLKMATAEKESRLEDMFLEMYNKGRESALFEREEELELLKFLEKKDPKVKVTLSDLRNKLARTQAELAKWQTIRRYEAYHGAPRPASEAETTLGFLKDSVFHYLTDSGKVGDQHLRAIVRILRFSETEKQRIAQAVIDRRNRTATGLPP